MALTFRVHKTRRMKSVETQYSEQLETLIPRLINQHWGQAGAAEEMGISAASLSYWMLRLGIRRVAMVT